MCFFKLFHSGFVSEWSSRCIRFHTSSYQSGHELLVFFLSFLINFTFGGFVVSLLAKVFSSFLTKGFCFSTSEFTSSLCVMLFLQTRNSRISCCHNVTDFLLQLCNLEQKKTGSFSIEIYQFDLKNERGCSK